MYIKRDLTEQIANSTAYIQVLLGPRQCGKSTLLSAKETAPLGLNFKEVSFDDLSFRLLANKDPSLFLSQFPLPLLLDEVQYVPHIFFELKNLVDSTKRAVLSGTQKEPLLPLFRLTGSNQLIMDKNIKESLAGRASYYQLNTLTVHEILQSLPETPIQHILFHGGWPELYSRANISTIKYLNDYIRTYIEKDVMLSAGVEKTSAFNLVLQLLAARTGQELNYTEISNNSGVSSITVKEWVGLLEKADLLYLLKPYFSNMTSRLIKTPKLYFLDTGLATRLQGWSDSSPLLTSPQAGHLFETLVCAEIVKFIRNYQKDWELFFWRTKEGEEVDFVLKTEKGHIHPFEVKLAIQGVPNTVSLPPSFNKHFPLENPLVIVTYGGQELMLSAKCRSLPIAKLHDYLKAI